VFVGNPKSRGKSAPRAIDPELLREATGPTDGRWTETVRERLLGIAHGLRDRAIEVEVGLEEGQAPPPPLPHSDACQLAAIYRLDADFLDALAGGR
jgi:hypothetical protein